jgi:hypothetical protein
MQGDFGLNEFIFKDFRLKFGTPARVEGVAVNTYSSGATRFGTPGPPFHILKRF